MHLALAHDQITKENWNPASLSELIYNEASAYMTDNNERIIIKGSDVLIAPEAFTVLALVMHEMITNSVKYGGLCDNRGRLDITLERDQDGGLVIHWMEVGGPPVKAPKRRGFGTTIIERSIPHELRGSAEISYNVSGVTATFVIPENYITNTLTKPVVASDPDIKQAEARMQTPDTVLIVEDNMIISLDAEDHFRALGSQNVHMTSNVAQAFTILENEAIDFALLDFNLGVETSEPVAEKLLEMNIPFVFASGYGDLSEIKKELAGIDVLQKPYGKEDILKALKTAK